MMKYVLTNKQMREADEYTIKTLGVSASELMERAGRALADEAEKLAGGGNILCVCGGGNNGGDGFVCARILRTRGCDVEAVFFAERISDECRENKARWEKHGGAIYEDIPSKKYALIVDCLVGTGLKGGLYGKNLAAVNKINELREAGAQVLSADIPSGLCGDNGRADGAAVAADVTLCIGELKAGALIGDGLDLSGTVKRADIGISLPKREYVVLTDRELAESFLIKRKRNSHKGSYGRAAIVAGSIEYTGAAYLAAAACLRAGAGYTLLFAPSELLPYYILKAPEILLKATNEGSRYAFKQEKMRELLDCQSIAYGMGMGMSEEVAKGAVYLLENYTGKLILDADGLNSLAAYEKENLKALFANKKCEVALTPHIKEFSRLSGLSVSEIAEKGMYAVQEFAEGYGVTVLLKNAASTVADGKTTYLVTAGTSGQAKGGSGDVLSGVIAGLCACMGDAPFIKTVALGAYIAGKAAELAAGDIGEYSMTATDTVGYLGKAFLFVAEKTDENGGEK